VKVAAGQLGFPLATNDPNRKRSILHASDIYNAYYEKTDPHEGENDPDLLFACGLAWEQYFEKTIIANGVQCFRPGELIGEWKGRDIAYSPDLILVNGKDRIGEIKFTWKSSRLKPGDRKFNKYLTQGKMYAYFTGIPRVTWFINHVRGDYVKQHFAQLKVWEVEFTKREILDEMRTMMNFAEEEDLFAKAEAGLLR
jgi:hypothetical protein